MNIRHTKIAVAAMAFVPLIALAGPVDAADDLGGVDTSFNTGGTGPNGLVLDIAFDTDGSMIIVGGFTEYNGEAVSRIARLDADGTLDTDFNATIGAGPSDDVDSVDIAADGSIYIAGAFSEFDGTAREGVARLDADGTLDPDFTIGYFETSNFPGAKVRPDIIEENEGTVWVAGTWDGYDNGGGLNYADPVVAFDGTGTNPSDAIQYQVFTSFGFQPTRPQGMKFAPDGDLVLYGRFNGPRTGIVKINPDGNIDETFQFAPDAPDNTGPNNTVTDVAFVGDSILAVGNFSTFHGDTAATGMVRLLADGSIDPTFDNPSASGMPDTTMAIDDDGNIYLVGAISDAFGGVGNFGRLFPDGQVDDAFPATIAAPSARVAASPAGDVYLYRDLSAFGGVDVGRLVRIVTGSAPSGPGAPGGVTAIPDGSNVIVSWTLPTEGETPEAYLAEAIPDDQLGGSQQPLPDGVAASIAVPSCTVPHPQTTCTITGLAPVTSYSIQVSSVLGDTTTPSAATVRLFTGTGIPNPTPNPTPSPGGGTLPATGSGLVLAGFAAGLLLAGTRLTRVARRLR
jgi:uncharacterized delta-60 repeat protein